MSVILRQMIKYKGLMGGNPPIPPSVKPIPTKQRETLNKGGQP